MQRGKIGFLRKMKKCEYLENCTRYRDFERIFDPQGSTRVSYSKGKIKIFSPYLQPSWI